MKLTIKRLKKGDWDKYKKTITKLENSAFTPEERTNKWVFRELIDKYKPYTTIFYYGRIPVGYYMAATLEDSAEKDEMKRIDKNFNHHNTLYLLSIGTRKEYQGKGVGRKMLKHLISISKSFERLSFHSKNPLFRKLAYTEGFRIVRYTRLDGRKMAYMARWKE